MKYFIEGIKLNDKCQSSSDPEFELSELIPKKIKLEDYLNKKIIDWSPYCGTYGMGGPGFLGFQFEDKYWLIIGIWDSYSKFLSNRRYDDCIGSSIVNMEIEEKFVSITFSNGVYVELKDKNIIESVFISPTACIWIGEISDYY